MYYWAIKWKSFTEADLLLSEKQAKFIDQKLDEPAENRGEFFKINGERYRYDDIRKVERTTRRIEDDTKKLYSGEAMKLSKEPLIDGEGCVVTNWYKMLVTPKEYESNYAKHSSYYLMDKSPDGYWIGIRCIEYENGERSDYLELCTKEEADKLWKLSSPHL